MQIIFFCLKNASWIVGYEFSININFLTMKEGNYED
jgi:hypothetical protein